MAFGCAVGWGAFVMTGTVFLPIDDQLGVAVGMTIGGLVNWTDPVEGREADRH